MSQSNDKNIKKKEKTKKLDVASDEYLYIGYRRTFALSLRENKVPVLQVFEKIRERIG